MIETNEPKPLDSDREVDKIKHDTQSNITEMLKKLKKEEGGKPAPKAKPGKPKKPAEKEEEAKA